MTTFSLLWIWRSLRSASGKVRAAFWCRIVTGVHWRSIPRRLLPGLTGRSARCRARRGRSGEPKLTFKLLWLVPIPTCNKGAFFVSAGREFSNQNFWLPELHFEMRLTAFASQIISCLHCSTILRYPFACNVCARPYAARSGRFSARHSTSQSKAEWERYVLDAQAVKSISNLNLGLSSAKMRSDLSRP